MKTTRRNLLKLFGIGLVAPIMLKDIKIKQEPIVINNNIIGKSASPLHSKKFVELLDKKLIETAKLTQDKQAFKALHGAFKCVI